MSLANVQRHWRALAVLTAIFAGLVALVPVIFYGVGPLLVGLVDTMGQSALLVIGGAVAVIVLGTLALALWLGSLADRAARNGGDR